MIRNAAELWTTSLTYWTLMAETQAVMTYRLLGLAGAWAVAPGESRRMVEEKAPAFVESLTQGAMAAMQGKRPDQVAMAVMRPLRHRTQANSRRLARRGPRLPGAPF